jgi:hypothetical protein
LYSTKKITNIYQFFLIVLFSITLFTNYQYLFIPSFLIVVTHFINKPINQSKLKFISILPYFFYFYRFTLATSESFNNSWLSISNPNYYLGARFLDLQQVLVSVKCNFSDVQNFYFKFSGLGKSCPWTAKYGPLLEVIPYFGNIWRDTLIFAFLILLSSLFLYRTFLKRFYDYQLVVVLLFLSPSMNFLLERMNIDIVILLIAFIAIDKYEIYPVFNSLIIFSLALLKIHPLGFTFGLIYYAYLKKKRDVLNLNILLTALFSLIYIVFYYFSSIVTEWRPSEPDLTVGILSDAKSLSEILDINLIFIYSLICALLMVVSLSKLIPQIQVNNDKNIIFIYTFGMLLVINMFYANFDYRIPLFIPLIIYLLRYLNNIEIILVMLHSILLPFGTDSLFPELEFIFIVIGKLSLYYLLALVIKIFFNELNDRNMIFRKIFGKF